MINHTVRVYPSKETLARQDQLAWKIAAVATDPVAIEPAVVDMVVNRIVDNAAVAVAALYACLIRKLLRQDMDGGLPAEPPTEIIAENRWLAARYGVLAFLGDVGGGGRVDIDDHLDALLREVAEDAGVPGYLVEDASKLDPAWLKGKKSVCITAGASTPEELVWEVIGKLREYATLDVSTMDGIVENVHFSLPDGLDTGSPGTESQAT